jgi:hypothetical protein
MMSTLTPTRAFINGVAAVIRAPMILVAAVVVMTVIALPFALFVGSRVQQSLASQPPVALDETEIDPEWWQEFRAQARGIESTFTPAIVGFAAPLDSISAVLDGRRPALAVIASIVVSAVAWAFLWGGALRRYSANQPIGLRRFVANGFQVLPRFVAIALAAALVIVGLYVTLHALLFGPVHELLVSRTTSERTAFMTRVVLYLIFLIPVATVGLLADYARIASMSDPAMTVGRSFSTALGFIQRNAGAVASLYLIGATIFVVVTVAYGALEVYAGSQLGGWRAVVVGQIYIVFRLAMRLTGGAAALRLFAARSTQ